MRTHRTLTVALTLCSALLAQPKDVVGWGKIIWGMTVPEVKAAYEGQTEDPVAKQSAREKFVTRLVIKELMVGDIQMTVKINSLSGSDRMSMVMLSAIPPQLKVVVGRSAYQSLKTSLTQKYGLPAYVDQVDRDGLAIRTSRWIFPSTEILLHWMESERFDWGYLDLYYTSADKKAIDVL